MSKDQKEVSEQVMKISGEELFRWKNSSLEALSQELTG